MVANPLHLLESNRPEALDKLTSVHVARQLTRHDRSLLNFDLLKKQRAIFNPSTPFSVPNRKKLLLGNHSCCSIKFLPLIGSLAYFLFGTEQEEGKFKNTLCSSFIQRLIVLHPFHYLKEYSGWLLPLRQCTACTCTRQELELPGQHIYSSILSPGIVVDNVKDQEFN